MPSMTPVIAQIVTPHHVTGGISTATATLAAMLSTRIPASSQGSQRYAFCVYV